MIKCLMCTHTRVIAPVVLQQIYLVLVHKSQHEGPGAQIDLLSVATLGSTEPLPTHALNGFSYFNCYMYKEMFPCIQGFWC